MESSPVEYTAQTVSPLINGEAKLVITGSGLALTTTTDAAEIPFFAINSLMAADFVVTVRADSGDYVFSKLGNWCRPFFDSLCEAYNKAVLLSLFVKGDPVVTAKGDYRYTEAARKAGGEAPVYVYENCVVVLPTNLGARRVPLCFTSGVDKGDFELTLRLDTGESYTFAKLGYDTAPFVEAVEIQMRALREKTLAAVKEIDPSLSTVQSSQLVKLIPHGAAASFGQLAGIAPSFAMALEKKVMGTRAADGYAAFKEVCEPEKILIGFRKNDAYEGEGEGPSAPVGMDIGALAGMDIGALAGGSGAGSVPEGGGEEEDKGPDQYLLWLIAPSPDGQFAAVEFAEANAATFVYKTGGDFDGFARQLSRALEAIDFRREVIRLSDEELLKPGYEKYFMASKRTAALGLIRANFAGRVIHSSPETWKRKLTELWSSR